MKGWIRQVLYDTLQCYLLIFTLVCLFLLICMELNTLAGRPAY